VTAFLWILNLQRWLDSRILLAEGDSNMKTYRCLAAGAVLFFLCVVFTSAGYAAASIDPAFEGTLVITSPDGEINLIEPGDAIPAIVNDSIIEVFDGKFKVTTAEGDTISVSCLEHEAALKGAASVTLVCGESSGKLDVEAGPVSLTDDEGKVVTLNTGESFDIQMPVLSEAAPTAEGEELGLSLDDSNTDPDSRSIEIQDNQDSPVSPEN